MVNTLSGLSQRSSVTQRGYGKVKVWTFYHLILVTYVLTWIRPKKMVKAIVTTRQVQWGYKVSHLPEDRCNYHWNFNVTGPRSWQMVVKLYLKKQYIPWLIVQQNITPLFPLSLEDHTKPRSTPEESFRIAVVENYQVLTSHTYTSAWIGFLVRVCISKMPNYSRSIWYSLESHRWHGKSCELHPILLQWGSF